MPLGSQQSTYVCVVSTPHTCVEPKIRIPMIKYNQSTEYGFFISFKLLVANR